MLLHPSDGLTAHSPLPQVRFCMWLPVQLVGNLIAIAALPRMGALYEAAGAAPAASVVAWGALYHLTLGFLLPGTLRRCFTMLGREFPVAGMQGGGCASGRNGWL